MTSTAGTRPLPSALRHQALGDDPLEHRGQLDADLPLVDAAGRPTMMRLIGLGGIDGMQGGEDQVAGLGGVQGGLDRLEVAHLADQDDVRILAQGAFQGDWKPIGIGADLALVDDALLVAVQELDRILDGDDMQVLRLALM